ncbi:MAG: hypothetical protein ACJAU6_003296 [Alphaproteobacteria bacterium]
MVFLISGCADTVKTSNHPNKITGIKMIPETAVGVSYFLPQRRMRLIASGKRPLKVGQGKIYEAIVTVSMAKSAHGVAKGETIKRSATLKAPKIGKNAAAIKSADTALAKATGELIKAKAGWDKAQTELDNLITRYMTPPDGLSKDCKLVVSLKLELLPPEPNSKLHYIAKLNHLPWRDDELLISVGENGLLSSATATSTDRTADILIEIAKLVGGAADGGFNIFAKKAIADKITCPQPFKFQQVFDPLSGDIDVVNGQLKKLLGNEEKFKIKVHQSTISESEAPLESVRRL